MEIKPTQNWYKFNTVALSPQLVMIYLRSILEHWNVIQRSAQRSSAPSLGWNAPALKGCSRLCPLWPVQHQTQSRAQQKELVRTQEGQRWRSPTDVFYIRDNQMLNYYIASSDYFQSSDLCEASHSAVIGSPWLVRLPVITTLWSQTSFRLC